MLVGAMKKLAPLLALLVAGCSGADTVDNAASFTTNNAVGAVDEQAPNAETSGAASVSERPETTSNSAPRDTTFSKIFGEQAEAAGVRDYLENHGKLDTALMKDSLNAAGLQLSDAEVTEYGQWVCEWVDPRIRYTVAMEGNGDSLQGDLRGTHDLLIKDTVEWLPGQRGITVSPEQVEKALPQAVLTTCLDEKGKQEILDNPGWF